MLDGKQVIVAYGSKDRGILTHNGICFQCFCEERTTGLLVYWEGGRGRGAKTNAGSEVEVQELASKTPDNIWAMAPFFQHLNVSGPVIQMHIG